MACHLSREFFIISRPLTTIDSEYQRLEAGLSRKPRGALVAKAKAKSKRRRACSVKNSKLRHGGVGASYGVFMGRSLSVTVTSTVPVRKVSAIRLLLGCTKMFHVPFALIKPFSTALTPPK